MKRLKLTGFVGLLTLAVLLAGALVPMPPKASADTAAQWKGQNEIDIGNTTYTKCLTNDCVPGGTSGSGPNNSFFFPSSWHKSTSDSGSIQNAWDYLCTMSTLSQNYGMNIITADFASNKGTMIKIQPKDSHGVCFGNDITLKLSKAAATITGKFINHSTILLDNSNVYSDGKNDDNNGKNADRLNFFTPQGKSLKGGSDGCATGLIQNVKVSGSTATATLYDVTTVGGLAVGCKSTESAQVILEAAAFKDTYAWTSQTTIAASDGSGNVYTSAKTGSTKLTFSDAKCTIDLDVASADSSKATTGKFSTDGPQCDSAPKGDVNVAAYSSSATLANFNNATDCAATDKDAQGNCKNSNDNTLDCGGGSFNWVICPLIDGGMKAANTLDGFIMDTLDIDVKPIFDNTGQKGTAANGYYTAWNSFRIIATALLIIGGLVMVASQALGFEFLDAYTVRKVLPRLLIAIIGISLSWPLMRLVVSFFDTLGFDVRALMYAPFKDFGGTLSLGTSALTTLGVGAALLIIGPASLTFILTALLAVFVGFIILVIRQVVVIMLIILAPVAIACYILPNTQKVWKLWSDNFLGLMLMFPIISALIAAGHIFSAVALKSGGGDTGTVVAQGVGIVAYFVPYFLLPLAARMATGVIGNLAGVVNDRGKGVFDRLKGARGNAAAKNLQAMKAGNRFKGDNFAAKAFNASTRNAANIPNAGLIPWKARSRMQAAGASHQAAGLAEYLDKNVAFSAIKGNDDYLQATMKSMGGGESESDWRRYLSTKGYEGRSLEQGVAQIRAAKRDVSSEIFEKAAVMANASTGTGWKEGGAGAMMQSINDAAGNDRHTAATMLAQMRGMAGQAGRLDLAGSGFGKQAAAMEAMHRGTMTQAQANEEVIEGALFTKGPGEYARARGQAVANMAPQMLKHLQKSHQALTTARASGNAQEITRAERSLAQDYAALDNLHDNLNHMAPENARIIADTVLSQRISANGPTVMEQIKALQQSGDAMGQAYQDTRKSYDRQQYAAEQGRPTEPES